MKALFFALLFVGLLLKACIKDDPKETQPVLSETEQQELEIEARERRNQKAEEERKKRVAATFESDTTVFAKPRDERSSKPSKEDRDKKIKLAQSVCLIMNSSDALTEPCQYSVWDKEITLYSNALKKNADDFCVSLKQFLKGELQGWTVKFYSPFSNGHTIAQCRL